MTHAPLFSPSPPFPTRLLPRRVSQSIVCTESTEALLLPSAPADRETRVQAYAQLHLSFQQALAQLEAAGAKLAPGFEDFAELCSIHQVGEKRYGSCYVRVRSESGHNKGETLQQVLHGSQLNARVVFVANAAGGPA
ncbi:MAG: hypothetical protein SGPRY_007718 [Prymnesium sp.]